MARKVKASLVGTAFVTSYYTIILLALTFLNKWFLKISLFGVTFLGIDLRVWTMGFLLFIFGLWLLLEVNDYLQFKKWRRSWK